MTGPITPPSGSTTYTITATDAVGNTSTATVTTKVDTTAPTVSCPSADTNWHTGTVLVHLHGDRLRLGPRHSRSGHCHADDAPHCGGDR